MLLSLFNSVSLLAPSDIIKMKECSLVVEKSVYLLVVGYIELWENFYVMQ